MLTSNDVIWDAWLVMQKEWLDDRGRCFAIPLQTTCCQCCIEHGSSIALYRRFISQAGSRYRGCSKHQAGLHLHDCPEHSMTGPPVSIAAQSSMMAVITYSSATVSHVTKTVQARRRCAVHRCQVFQLLRAIKFLNPARATWTRPRLGTSS